MGTYFKVALRILHREKLYALINIAGLALAIGSCIVLALYLRNELTYDRHHVNHAKIYRVANEFSIGGTEDRFAVTSPVLGEMLAAEYPEVEDYTRFRSGSQNRVLIRSDTDAYYWDRVYFADDNVFRIFTHDVIYGDPETALVDPASIAVSETFARRYFGDENPIGRTVTTDGNVPIAVTLVFADLPENSHLKYDALLSSNVPFLQNPDNPTARRQILWNVGLYTYLVMADGYDAQDFNALSAEFYERHMASVGESIGGRWRAWLQPLADIHLDSDVAYDEPTGNPYYIYGFAAVGLFILLVACINYVNLATARATRRARGVGIRKILGSDRWSLIAQFLGEAVLFSLIAAVVGIVLAEIVLTLTPIGRLVGAELSLNLLEDPWLALLILGVGALIGVLAGLYPAIYLSAWAPLSALVGQNRASKANVRFRQVLVFTQFAISIAVIAGTLLMSQQMRFIADMPLGFAKENRVLVTLRGVDVIERAPTLMSELAADSRILGVTTAGSMMGGTFAINVVQVEGNDGTLQPTTINHMAVGEEFLGVMGMSVSEGRDFSRRLLTDVGASVVVNRTFVRNMGWDEPLGKRVQLGARPGRVIGVVEDFNFASLHTAVEPFAMYPLENDFSNVNEINRPFVTRFLVVNVAGEEIARTLRLIEQKVRELDPGRPFEYRFLDDSLDELYASEENLMRLLAIFAAICILVACLGLFGLAAFTTEQRTKEIGIRKVLGASAGQIIWLLSRNVLLLVLAGAAFASVAAYLAIDEWLAAFAYRAPINPFVFAVSTLVAAAVAFLTIALQSYGTAHDDPVEALRYE